MATASQKMMEIKFLLLILGVLIAPPSKLAPVRKMPHAAPITEQEIATTTPMDAQL